MRIIHTSDWHLGHQLLGVSREFEQQQFLDWLFEQLKTQKIDALIVAGDIFDSANPPAWAWRLLYQFLAKVKQNLPKLDLLLVAGNHDSPSKLDAPDHLLKAFDIHLIGALPRLADNQLDHDKLIIPLTDSQGNIAVRVAAVPFLRPGDLDLSTLDDSTEDKLIAGVERIYSELAQTISQLNEPNQGSIATAHAYLVSSEISEMSERRILGGNQHALPVESFSRQFDYCALGHLHKPQQLAQQAVFYSGSPIPMSLAEKDYKHQVKLVEFTQGQLSDVQGLIVPRCVDVLKVPSYAQPLEQVLSTLASMEFEPLEPHRQPLLEVMVLLDKPQAMLREKIAQVLSEKAVRLVKITTQYVQDKAPVTAFSDKPLDQLQPEQVFELKYHQQYNTPPPQAYQAAFSELMSQCEQIGED
ncbi:exonuclease SbcCD subunit D C-terminal domain-containing protein [Psychrobium sp. 1_MG-2023]|uniref:exonuclease SbcCD subunit D C-terminal domain-containing protein n=1 Tax=Psychrobium sp. 1_MG-2023 TaxID=3062624 RepID=UPI000C33DAF1|nr:exonuclease SbcCD subunit D C-terminal domain-containing protein [Psychrobium sp. 1_MG-2023]MDP2560923.1 exonuclease SbcCD subunit D C-terminal domain-containing protein [Psychrobium sp. 1_MG-2023]PKF55997.1 exonuclease sbcCD subunit D [Alteromonadales bacterium alter-6D02]